MKRRNHTEEDEGDIFTVWICQSDVALRHSVMMPLCVFTETFPGMVVCVTEGAGVLTVWVSTATSCLFVRKTLV